MNLNGISVLQSEIDAIESGSGLNADGTYLPDSTAHFTNMASSLSEAIVFWIDKWKQIFRLFLLMA